MIQAPASKIYLKVLAFCAAVGMWFLVITVENHVSVLPDTLQVKVENLEKSLSLIEAMPKAKLFLGVDKSVANGMPSSDFEVIADLTDLGAGEHLVHLTARTKSDKIQVLKIEPSELRLKLSPAVEKEVEVKVRVKGEAAAEHIIEKTKAAWDTVKIRGAQSVIDKVSYVEAELVLDGTQKEETSQTVSLKVPTEANIERNLLVIDPEQILVTATISSELKSKEVNVVAGFSSESERTAWEKRITLSPSIVTIQGTDADIKMINSIQTLTFEISALNRSGFVTAGLNLPTGVSTSVPDQKITISMTQKRGEKIIDVPVSVKVGGEPVNMSVSPSTVRVGLSGPKDLIDSINEGDIIAVIKRDSPIEKDESAELTESDISIPVGLSVMSYSPKTFMLLQPSTI